MRCDATWSLLCLQEDRALMELCTNTRISPVAQKDGWWLTLCDTESDTEWCELVCMSSREKVKQEKWSIRRISNKSLELFNKGSQHSIKMAYWPSNICTLLLTAIILYLMIFRHWTLKICKCQFSSGACIRSQVHNFGVGKAPYLC